MKHFLILALMLCTSSLFAQEQTDNSQLEPSKVDFDGFVALTKEVQAYRESRMVDFKQFLQLLKDENVLLLDTRSESAYASKHIAGAVHLSFSDFTEEKLAKVIPSKETIILIYCNNNIDGDEENFALKAVPLALNIPTFINLYGYGYKNIYELSALVPVNHKKLKFEGK